MVLHCRSTSSLPVVSARTRAPPLEGASQYLALWVRSIILCDGQTWISLQRSPELILSSLLLTVLILDFTFRIRPVTNPPTSANKGTVDIYEYLSAAVIADPCCISSLHQANLPIGSGATESTCWQMQRRVQRPGQSWETPGLRGILAVRALVISERWSEAWKPYAASHRKVVHCVN
jgi:hypothetical protein